MRRTLATFFSLSFVGLLVGPALAADTEHTDDTFMHYARGIIAAHRSNFLAATIEAIADPSCSKSADRTYCQQPVRAKDFLCGLIDNHDWPRTASLSIYIGDKPVKSEPRLVIVVPSDNPNEGWVSLFNGPATEDNVSTLQAVCQEHLSQRHEE